MEKLKLVIAKFNHLDSGYESDQERVRKSLVLHNEYEVGHINMGQSNTAVYLKGVSSGFNHLVSECKNSHK